MKEIKRDMWLALRLRGWRRHILLKESSSGFIDLSGEAKQTKVKKKMAEGNEVSAMIGVYKKCSLH